MYRSSQWVVRTISLVCLRISSWLVVMRKFRFCNDCFRASRNPFRFRICGFTFKLFVNIRKSLHLWLNSRWQLFLLSEQNAPISLRPFRKTWRPYFCPNSTNMFVGVLQWKESSSSTNDYISSIFQSVSTGRRQDTKRGKGRRLRAIWMGLRSLFVSKSQKYAWHRKVAAVQDRWPFVAKKGF